MVTLTWLDYWTCFYSFFIEHRIRNDAELSFNFHSLLFGLFIHTGESYSIVEILHCRQRLPSYRGILWHRNLDPRCIYNSAPIFAFTLTSSSVLTYVKEAGYENNAALCPSFDTCTKNCRKEYSVEKTLTQVTLTSTFTDTTECVCDKLVFNYESLSGDESISLISTSTGFGTPANTLQIQQYTSAALDMWIMEENSSGGATVDCLWEYSISTPSTTPSSSSTSKLKVLVGLFSATFVALTLA